ncbi:MAG: hypothetical protein KatS3mg050_0759 [Litorilinea sp.]|nr:MAG: hypothetical protein KatS3mg050_0759 [Litorilinea sp.]
MKATAAFWETDMLRPLLRWPYHQLLAHPTWIRRWLDVRLLSEVLDRYPHWPYGGEEVIHLDGRGVDPQIPALLPGVLGAHRLGQPFVASLSQVELVGPYAVVRQAGGYIVPELNPLVLDRVVKAHVAVRPRRGRTTSRYPLLASLVQPPWCGRRCGYFHWITDCLTRLEGVEQYQKITGEQPLILLPPSPAPWMQESLTYMGIGRDRQVAWSGDMGQVETLVFPSPRTLPVQRKKFNPYSVAGYWYVKERIQQAIAHLPSDFTPAPRIYISRGDAQVRRVLNEDVLLRRLEAFHVVPYQLSRLSFADQVRLFAQAELVIAPHGAGLVNMIFGQRPAILEIYTSTFVPGYFIIAQSLGFPYAGVRGEDCGGHLVVDPEAVARRVEGLLSIRKP